MATANRIEASRPARTPEQAGTQAPTEGAPRDAWEKAIDQAEALLCTLESLAMAASAVLGSATRTPIRERRQFERARLCLTALPDRAQHLAGLLDAPGGAHFVGIERIQAARDAIDELAGEVNDAIGSLRALDCHGEQEGAGASALHSDVVLGVLIEQLERADTILNGAMLGHVATVSRGRK